jgi:glycosyltransferase involved in cell wall biosynthesis
MARARSLSRMLERRYEVEILGPILGSGIWPPIAEDTTLKIRSIRASIWPTPYWRTGSVADLADGDIVYASKPLVTSLGVGVRVKKRTGKPLILDVDDWEPGFVSDRFARSSFLSRLAFIGASAVLYYRPGSYWNVLLSERLTGQADAVTVSNTFLQERFGGTIVRHARDTDELDPGRFEPETVRNRHGVPKDAAVVLFLGTPTAYKGIEDLIEAVARLKRPDVLLFVIGMDYRKAYCRRVSRLGKGMLSQRFRPLGFQPLKRLPEFLAMTDVFVVPQRMAPASVGQLPAKLFDAMAMAKPIVATAVGDIPEILAGCGRVVKPDCPDLLADAVQDILADPDEAQSLGKRARQECIDKYSHEVVAGTLIEVFEKYE